MLQLLGLEAGGRHQWLALQVVLNHVAIHAVAASRGGRRVHRVDICDGRAVDHGGRHCRSRFAVHNGLLLLDVVYHS